MAAVIVNRGKAQALTSFTGVAMTLRLYSNNQTPSDAQTAANYTEVTGSGYSAIALGSWIVNEADPATASHAKQTFTFTGAAGNVYGYYVTRNSDGALMFAERFSDGPYNIVNNGDSIGVTPNLSADSV